MKILRVVVLVAVLAIMLYFAFRGVDLKSLPAEFARTNLLLIVAGTLLLFVSHVFRAWRWTVILRPIKPHTSVWVGWKAIMSGYAMNNVIPRSGELVRPFVFAKHEKVFMSGAIATILIERVVDMISNIIFILLALLLFPKEIAKAFPAVSGAMSWVVVAMGILLVLVMVMIFSADKTKKLIFRITKNWKPKFRNPIDRAATEFSSGLRGVRAGGALPVLAGTLGIWVFYVLSMYVWCLAFPEPEIVAVGLVGSFFLRVVSGIAFLIPIPGGIGPYHYLISQALFRIFGVALPAAVAYATLTNAAMYILTTVCGLIILGFEGVSFKNFRKVAKATSDHSAVELDEVVREQGIRVGALGIEK